MRQTDRQECRYTRGHVPVQWQCMHEHLAAHESTPAGCICQWREEKGGHDLGPQSTGTCVGRLRLSASTMGPRIGGHGLVQERRISLALLTDSLLPLPRAAGEQLS